MSTLKIAVRKDPAQYCPGEEIAGAAQWTTGNQPEAVEVRLLWYTHGRGTEDVCQVDTVRFDAPLQDDTRPFRFTAPEAPYSLAGTLVSLDWVVELIALPSKESDRIIINISPNGKPVVLGKQPERQ